MPYRLLVALLVSLLAALAGCKGPSAAQPAGPAPLLIAPEDLLTIRNTSLSSGPAITGSIQPERKADLRAEVPAIVLAVRKENGDAVKKGDLLVRLDDTSIRDALASAEAASRAAENQDPKGVADAGLIAARAALVEASHAYLDALRRYDDAIAEATALRRGVALVCSEPCR